MTDFEVYQIGWDDGNNNNRFQPEYVDNEHYCRGFCNGAYFRAITPNKACTRLETGAANADSESNPAVSSG